MTFTGVGQSAKLTLPVFTVWEEDFDGLEFHKGQYLDGVTPLLPGHQTRTVEGVFVARNDSSCHVKLYYRITYTLRQYPDL